MCFVIQVCKATEVVCNISIAGALLGMRKTSYLYTIFIKNASKTQNANKTHLGCIAEK